MEKLNLERIQVVVRKMTKDLEMKASIFYNTRIKILNIWGATYVSIQLVIGHNGEPMELIRIYEDGGYGYGESTHRIDRGLRDEVTDLINFYNLCTTNFQNNN